MACSTSTDFISPDINSLINKEDSYLLALITAKKSRPSIAERGEASLAYKLDGKATPRCFSDIRRFNCIHNSWITWRPSSKRQSRVRARARAHTHTRIHTHTHTHRDDARNIRALARADIEISSITITITFIGNTATQSVSILIFYRSLLCLVKRNYKVWIVNYTDFIIALLRS